MFKPTIGTIVLYTLSAQDAAGVNKRRKDAKDHPDLHTDTGVLIHVGNQVIEGERYPMIITRSWGSLHTSAVNGQVFLDGNDLLWVTSVALGTGPRSFAEMGVEYR